MPVSKLPAALDAPCHQITLSAGEISYYVDEAQNDARPLVLLHSINAAPSAREMQPLFEHYRHKRTVYAPDLPGYDNGGPTVDAFLRFDGSEVDVDTVLDPQLDRVPGFGVRAAHLSGMRHAAPRPVDEMQRVAEEIRSQ